MDNSGRFGIGTSFAQPLDEPGQSAFLAISPPSTPIYDESTPGDPFFMNPVKATPSPIAAPPQHNYTVPKPGTIGPSLLPVMSLPSDATPKTTSNGNNKQGKGGNTNRYCEVCDISVTSDQQMETHITGQKHQKKCKQIGEIH